MSISAHRFRRRSRAATEVRLSLVVAFVATTAAAWGLQSLLEVGRSFPIKTMMILALALPLIAVLADRHLVSPSFGPANRVTLARAAMTALLVALIGESPGPAGAWFSMIVASMAVGMDGIDGWLARRRGDAGGFGARFDMETDAALILVTSVLVWQFGKAGPWVLAAGLLRYVFVASGYVLEWMRRRLPKSRRRQTICVLGALSLALCLAPPILPPLSDLVAAAGLLLLTGSFGIDVAWLARAGRRA
jgi:phosphatidylglycerophosphate synthase